MPKLSAGIVLYRHRNQQVEILLVHPGGPFWAKKDSGAWSIPKGEYQPNEDIQAAARREFAEELGQPVPAGDWQPLSVIKYGNKQVTAWAVEATLDIARLVSNSFRMEWPPKSGQEQEFPEVDRAEWCMLPIAMQKIVPGQQPLLQQLAQNLGVTLDPMAEPPKQLNLL